MRLHNNCLNLIVDGVVGHVAMCDHALYRKVMKYGWIAMSCRKLGTIFRGTNYGCPMKPFFINISNFWANWEDRSNKSWGIFGCTTIKLGFKERLKQEQVGNSEQFPVTNMPAHLINSEKIGFSEQKVL